MTLPAAVGKCSSRCRRRSGGSTSGHVHGHIGSGHDGNHVVDVGVNVRNEWRFAADGWNVTVANSDDDIIFAVRCFGIVFIVRFDAANAIDAGATVAIAAARSDDDVGYFLRIPGPKIQREKNALYALIPK